MVKKPENDTATGEPVNPAAESQVPENTVTGVKKRPRGRPPGRARSCTGNYKKPKIYNEIRPLADPVHAATTILDAEGNATYAVLQQPDKKKSNGTKFGLQTLPPEGQTRAENAATIRLALASLDLPAIDVSDPVQVRDRVIQYLEFCEQYDRMPSMVGMANWLGVSKPTLDSWKRGDFREDTHTPVIQKACSIMEEMAVEYLQKGRVNPAAGIFLLKNLFQYKDVQDVVVTPQNPLGNAEKQEQLEDKYLDIVDVSDNE